MAKKLDEPQERGDFFKSLGTLFAGFVAQRIEGAVTGLGPTLLRPPGALDEFEFLTKCTRCDKCFKACPENALVRGTAGAGLSLKTPYIDPRVVPCFLCTALPCIGACEDGALVWPTRTLEDGSVQEGPRAVRMGTARIKERLCVTWEYPGAESRDCRVCVDRCPYPEEAIRMVPDAAGGRPHPQIVEDVCTGCGICVFSCPAEPGAIVVDPRQG